MSLGKNIKKYREKARITQKELAEKIGLKAITVRKYENDEREPNIAKITDIASVLGIKISDLLEVNETLTSKAINVIDKVILKDNDAENTLELICELANVDIDTLNKSSKNNIELSENCLINLFTLLHRENPIEFMKFTKDNIGLIKDFPLLEYKIREILKDDDIEKEVKRQLEVTGKEMTLILNLRRIENKLIEYYNITEDNCSIIDKLENIIDFEIYSYKSKNN